MNNLENPLVSIIIPTFNRGDLLLETVNSILTQSYSNFELIIISDGSTDNTEFLIASLHDSRLYFKHLETNSGLPAKVRNVGISFARGTYIAFCDDDDLWLPNKLEVQLDAFRRSSEVGLVCSSAIYLFPDGSKKLNLNVLNVLKKIVLRLGFIPKKYLLMGMNFIINSSVVIKSEILELGDFNEHEGLRGSEDFDYWVRISEFYKIEYISSPLICYRIHAKQLVSVGGNGKPKFLSILSQHKKDNIQKIIFLVRNWLYSFFKI